MVRHNSTGQDWQAGLLASALLGLSIALGGGGSPAPIPETVLLIATAVVAAAWFSAGSEPWRQVPRTAWVIAGLALALPLVQLLPLPPGLWHALPGRLNQKDALDLVGAGDTWRALTLSPPRTLASLLAAAAGGFVLVLVASLDRRVRERLIATTAIMGIATVLVGAAQLSGGIGNPFRFFDPEEIFLTGFQANHNSTADLILIAMLAAAAWLRLQLDAGVFRPRPWQLAAVVVVSDGLFALALFLAGSRAGIALLPLVLVLQFVMLQPKRSFPWGRFALCAVAAVVLVALAFAVLRDNREVAQILARFTFAGEFRPELWIDSVYALGQYWPAGSGMGTFVPVMMAVERLEVVDPTLPNRAHNDYLELAITGGLPGLLILGTISALVIRAAWRAIRRADRQDRPQVLFALGTLAIVGLHSLVDYPLRSMALTAVAATAVGLLLFPRQAEPARTERSHS